MDKYQKIRLIAADVDGSLTDGRVIQHSDGRTSRIFNTLDGHGIELAQNAGVEVIVMSRSISPEIMYRAEHLKCDYYLGLMDKQKALKRICQDRGINPHDVCYFGNDITDLQAMGYSGYPACPHDAHPEILFYITSKSLGFVAYTKGGHGAFRELIDHLKLHDWTPRRYGYPSTENTEG